LPNILARKAKVEGYIEVGPVQVLRARM